MIVDGKTKLVRSYFVLASNKLPLLEEKWFCNILKHFLVVESLVDFFLGVLSASCSLVLFSSASNIETRYLNTLSLYRLDDIKI